MSTPTNIVTFLDAIGRTLIGETVAESTTAETLAIKNPAIVHIMPNPQTGQLQLQILPLFFKEFLADKTESTVWYFKRSNLTESKEFALDFKLVAQYQQISSFVPDAGAVQGSVGQEPSEPSVVKLFDEE
jgi:hypothetical protein